LGRRSNAAVIEWRSHRGRSASNELKDEYTQINIGIHMFFKRFSGEGARHRIRPTLTQKNDYICYIAAKIGDD